MQKLTSAIGYLTLFFGLIILSPIWRGYVLSKLWTWFIQDKFGLPAIGIATAIGISYIVTLLTYQYYYIKDERTEDQKIASGFLILIFIPLLSLIFGSIVKNFI